MSGRLTVNYNGFGGSGRGLDDIMSQRFPGKKTPIRKAAFPNHRAIEIWKMSLLLCQTTQHIFVMINTFRII
jgi:hypothetical protein